MGRTLRAGEVPSTVVNCEHAVECAGCPLIHLDYAQQLGSKRARVVTATVTRGGYRDGVHGLVVAMFAGLHTFVKYAKAWERLNVNRDK